MSSSLRDLKKIPSQPPAWMFSFYEVYIPAGLKQDLTETRLSIKRYSFTSCMLRLQSKDENSPKTRDQNLSLLLPPCSSRPSPECTLTRGQLPRGSGSTARVERPSLCAWETFFRCGKAVGFGHLPGNAWSPGQRRTPPILDTGNSSRGFLARGGAQLPCFALSTQPHSRSLTVTILSAFKSKNIPVKGNQLKGFSSPPNTQKKKFSSNNYNFHNTVQEYSLST